MLYACPLSSTPTWIACLPHQHGSSGYVTNTKLEKLSSKLLMLAKKKDAVYYVIIFDMITPLLKFWRILKIQNEDC